MEAPLRCCGAFGAAGTAADGGEEERPVEVEFERGLNMSTMEARRRRWGGGEGGPLGSAIRDDFKGRQPRVQTSVAGESAAREKLNSAVDFL